ncbi:hypothetical protein IAT38_004857 [Cryptococcus sp. DSM 104549]
MSSKTMRASFGEYCAARRREEIIASLKAAGTINTRFGYESGVSSAEGSPVGSSPGGSHGGSPVFSQAGLHPLPERTECPPTPRRKKLIELEPEEGDGPIHWQTTKLEGLQLDTATSA